MALVYVFVHEICGWDQNVGVIVPETIENLQVSGVPISRYPRNRTARVVPTENLMQAMSELQQKRELSTHPPVRVEVMR